MFTSLHRKCFGQIHSRCVTSSTAFPLSLLFIYSNCHAGWGDIMIFTTVLRLYQIYLTWTHPSTILFHPPSSHSWNGFSRSHFSILYTYAQNLHHIHPHTLSPPPPLLTATSPGPVLLPCSPILYKKRWKRKKWHFWLFKITAQGVSLWHFHVCRYYNLNWFIPSIFLLSTLVLFLWCFQQV
jgi:hypothetical protein